MTIHTTGEFLQIIAMMSVGVLGILRSRRERAVVPVVLIIGAIFYINGASTDTLYQCIQVVFYIGLYQIIKVLWWSFRTDGKQALHTFLRLSK